MAACAGAGVAPPPIGDDADATLARSRALGRDVVLFFALPGRDASDRMERETWTDPRVHRAIADGGFLLTRVDAFVEVDRYRALIGGGEGMGVCVVDTEGRPFAARPGFQEADELAAFLQRVARRRPAVVAARTAVAVDPADMRARFALGDVLLDLGERRTSERELTIAAKSGVAAARHRLARRHALDGDVTQARAWLSDAPPSLGARVTEGYVLFKERRHREAVATFAALLRDSEHDLADERQRVLYYLGKSLHEAGRDADALARLSALAAEGTGSTFEAAARHALRHILDPDHGHTH